MSLICDTACHVAILSIPEEMAGWEFTRDRNLEVGIAHGSRAIDGATEIRKLHHRSQNDNARHHGAIITAYDWCWGSDAQWLVSADDDSRYYSHDHGHYLPGGPNWTSEQLVASVDDAHEYQDPGDGLDLVAMTDVIEKLSAVGRDDLAKILRRVPPEWDVSDDELETLGFFLERRGAAAAERLRQRFGG